MGNDESKNTEQVLQAITAIKEIAEDDKASSDAKEGVNLESIVRKLSRRHEKSSSK